MVTGHHYIGESTFPRIHTGKLTVCGEHFIGPEGLRLNYMAGALLFGGSPDGLINPYPAGAPVWNVGVNDWSMEFWIRPRANGITYGTDVPYDAGTNLPKTYRSAIDIGTGGTSASWVGAAAPQQMAVICLRQGAGFQFYFNSFGDAEATITQAFPPDMEQWFHLAANVDRGGNSEFFVNAVSAGVIATGNVTAFNTNFYFWGGQGWAGGANDNSFPTVGAFAAHTRIMTAVEVAASYASRTVSILDAGASTPWAFDVKDTLFRSPITYTVASVPPNEYDQRADTYLGDAVVGTNSTVTYRGAFGGAIPVMYYIPNRSAGNPSQAYTDWGTRFGYFDGR